jgi:hypothetical protein
MRKAKRRKQIFKALFLLIFLAGTAIAAKFIFFPDEKAKIRRTLSLAVSEIEEKNPSKFIRHFTLDYRDSFNNTYGTLFLYLKNNLNQCKSISVGLNQMEIDVKENQAVIKFFAAANVVTTDGELYKEAGRFILRMRKEQLAWRIYRLDEMDYEFE